MADILCPMCGKANPDHLDECQFCTARLKPLIAGESKSQSAEEPESDGADDWLLSLRPGEDDAQFDGEEDLPDWLQEFDDETSPDEALEDEPDQEDFSITEAPEESDLPLFEDSVYDDTGEDEIDAFDGPKELPDWLQRTEITKPDVLPDEDDFFVPDEEESPIDEFIEGDQKEDETFPAWPTDEEEVEEEAGPSESEVMEKPAPAPPETTPPKPRTPPVEAEVPDWLSELGPVEETATTGAGLGWLSRLGQEEADAADDTQEVIIPPEQGDLPDWVAGISPEDAAPADETAEEISPEDSLDEEELPAWFSELDLEEEAEPVETAAQEEPVSLTEAGGEEVPDWMSDLDQEEEAEPSTEEAEETEGFPDWIAELGLEEEVVEEPAPLIDSAPGENGDQEGFPDWLSELDEEAEVEPEEELAPDWMSELDEEAEAEPEVELAPDWMAELGEEAEAEPEVELAPDWMAELDEEAEAEPEVELAPDWMDEVGEEAEAEPEVELAPDWMDELEEEAEAEPEVELAPDWMAELDEEAEAEPEVELAPDWMAELDEEAEAEPEVELAPDWMVELDEEEEVEPEVELAPDWMAELDEEAEAEPEVELAPDWMAELDEEAEAEPEVELAPDWMAELDEEEEVEPEVELAPDWMAELEEEAEAEPEVELAPDWMAELDEEAEVEPDMEGEMAEDEGPPDWLRAFADEEFVESEDEFEEVGAVEEFEPADVDWFSELSVEGEPEILEDEPPDFLSDIGEDAPVAEVEQAAARIETPQETEKPDWLDAFDEEDEGESEGLPDWLTEIEKDHTAVDLPGEETPETAIGAEIGEEAEEGLPDWLEEVPQLQADSPRAVEEVGKEDLPPWLDEFDFEEEEPEGAAQEDDVPGWLSSSIGPVTGDVDAVRPPVEEELEPDFEDMLADLSEGATAAEEAETGETMPDWLSEYSEEGGEEAIETPSGDSPDWLTNLQDRSIGEIEFEGADWTQKPAEEDLEETDALDWMPQQDSALSIDQLASGEGIEEGLAPGELPEWLKAMRPEDVAKPGTMEAGEYDTGAVERVGPLAGLRGVLSAEPAVSQTGQTPPQFVRLQISSTQQQRADQLQKMIASETATQPAKRGPILSEQRVLRYIIATVLAFIAIFPLVLPGYFAPLPPKPPEMARVDGLISTINENSRVLVVLDYQPGMSGEIDAAAFAVVDHLMLQRPKLALVSTELTGPALGERLIQVMVQHGYEAETEYVNLGYLPGDSTGLQLFAEDPFAATKLGYNNRPLWALLDEAGNNPWNRPALQGIGRLSDFEMTLLLSDDPDTIRRWVEQVSPALRPSSLLIVSSAQAVPLLRPYYDAQNSPIAAFVPGLAGGAAYEGFLLREGPARDNWDAFSLGSLVAIILVLGAGTYNLYFVWKEREAERRGRA